MDLSSLPCTMFGVTEHADAPPALPSVPSLANKIPGGLIIEKPRCGKVVGRERFERGVAGATDPLVANGTMILVVGYDQRNSDARIGQSVRFKLALRAAVGVTPRLPQF